MTDADKDDLRGKLAPAMKLAAQAEEAIRECRGTIDGAGYAAKADVKPALKKAADRATKIVGQLCRLQDEVRKITVPA